MNFFLERTVREHRTDDQTNTPSTLAAHASTDAWVLMGDPGAGKTHLFKNRAEIEGGTYISARDFIDLEPPASGYSSPLFIDGLDEYIADAGQTALGEIRRRLQQLGTPRFRIACREADWRGQTDSEPLKRLIPEGRFSELHLEPLSEDQVVAFIAHQMKWDESQTRHFVDSAQAHDLEGLLHNPQTLLMLLQSATSSTPPSFPSSKQQAYAIACDTLLQEHNDTHLSTANAALTTHQLRDAAGYMCAVLLLSGCSFIIKNRRPDTPAHALALNALLIHGPNALTPQLEACQEALKSKLFVGTGSGRFEPCHRTVAEYLAACYVAQRLQAGLPLTRVLALMQGEDGGVVPALRGVHAWLAVVSVAGMRENLIDRDPLGLVLHGDVRGFTTTEKIRLLTALQQEATRYAYFRNQNWASQPFGALATANMQAHFLTLLQSTDRHPTHLAVLDCVLDALRHGDHMPELMPALEQVVRDESYWGKMRQSALACLCKYNDIPMLRRLLNDMEARTIEDSNMDLRGALLHHLYPAHIPATELWQYYRPMNRSYFGQYALFWLNLPKNAPKENTPALLDALLASPIRLGSSGQEYRDTEQEFMGELLVIAVEAFGASIETPRLYNWLGLGLDDYQSNSLLPEHQQKIADWLGTHPAQYKALVEHGIPLLADSQPHVHLWLYELRHRLCHATPPADAAQWLLSLAEHQQHDFRFELIAEAHQHTQQLEGMDAALQMLSDWAAAHPEDAERIERTFLLCPYPPDSSRQHHLDRERERQSKKEQKKAEDLQFFREHLPRLTGPTPRLDLLNYIGTHYLDLLASNKNETPHSRLLKALHNEAYWVEMALAGLRCCLERLDLPSAQDIITLNKRGAHYKIALLCLAAIDLRYTEQASAAFDGLPPHQLASLVAFRLTNDFGEMPAWYKQLLTTQPELIAEIMQTLILAQIKAQQEYISSIYALARDERYALIAQGITPALIQALPAKASKKQHPNIRLLIVCLLRRLPRSTQLALIQDKLAQPKMDVTQRIYWLTAGLLVSPDEYIEALKKYLGNQQLRASYAFELLNQVIDVGIQTQDNISPPVRAFFIRLLGVWFAPVGVLSSAEDDGKDELVRNTIETAEFVRHQITALANDHTEAATQALSELEKHPALHAWHAHIRQAAYEQHIVRRKALFRPASVDAVCNTLAALQPANAADLWALTVDHLTALAHHIRNGSTNDYRQYWNEDQKTPKIENDCRDALLSDLKLRLQATGVSAEREGNYADDKRADIKVIFGQWHIPVEIKREMHSDVWTAIPNQLIAKYSRETSSDGYGVYIVFWFMGDIKAPAADGGRKPTSAQELQERLQTTIPPTSKNKIAILVIDCSLPKDK